MEKYIQYKNLKRFFAGLLKFLKIQFFVINNIFISATFSHILMQIFIEMLVKSWEIFIWRHSQK